MYSRYCAAIVLGVLAAVGARHADLAVVEVRAVLGIDHAHVVGLVDVNVAGNELDVLAVLQHDILEDLQRKLGKLHGLASPGLDFLAPLLVNASAHAAGQAPVGMHAAAAHHLDQGVAVVPHLEHVLGHVHADLGHDAQDVALGRRGGRPDDEIGTAQGVEVRRMVGGVENAVEQLAELLGRRRRIDVEHGVEGLGGRQVVGLGADAADPRRQVRHVLGRPAHAELLEAAKLRNLQIGVGHVALLVEEDVDLAVTFEPRNGINRNTFHHSPFRSGTRGCLTVIELANADGCMNPLT